MEADSSTSGRVPFLVLYIVFCAVISHACSKNGRTAISDSPPVFSGGAGKTRSIRENTADDVSAGIIHNSIPKGVLPFAIDSRAAGKACGFYTKHFANALENMKKEDHCASAGFGPPPVSTQTECAEGPNIFNKELTQMKRNLSLSVNVSCSNAAYRVPDGRWQL